LLNRMPAILLLTRQIEYVASVVSKRQTRYLVIAVLMAIIGDTELQQFMTLLINLLMTHDGKGAEPFYNSVNRKTVISSEKASLLMACICMCIAFMCICHALASAGCFC
jgi:membrane-anchored glycerophosphoryl diester phosphodiesterase (GDPDase)